MKTEKSFSEKLAGAATTVVVVYLIADFVLNTTIGMFLFLTALWGTGALVLLGGITNMVTDAMGFGFALTDHPDALGIFALVCYLVSALFTAAAMLQVHKGK